MPSAALLVLGSITTAPAQAQATPEPAAINVAKTPLRDLGIDPRDIPEVLRGAERAPYALAGIMPWAGVRASSPAYQHRPWPPPS